MAELSTGALPAQTHTQSIEARVAIGRACRERVQRKDQAIWAPPAGRRDPIDILVEQGKERLAQLLPIRYGRMSLSPFAFLRGAAAVMASDLAATPSTGLVAQAAGDCHCLNFGGFATPERRLVFDINDFDETAVAPWEWDLKRLATSFAVATLDRFDKTARGDLAQTAAGSYRETMASLAAEPVLDAWYLRQDLEDDEQARAIGLPPDIVRRAGGALVHAVEIAPIRRSVGAAPRIEDDPPLVYRPTDAELASFHEAIVNMMPTYRQSLTPERQVLLDRYRLADAVMKVVGVGAVGTRCGVVLMVSGDGEALNLQFKEATASVLEAHAGASPYAHHGERVVRGQRLIQAASDIFLGFTTGPEDRHVYVRQLHDAKIKPQLETMSAKDLRRYAQACGAVLARAHARSADAVVLSAYIGKSPAFDEAIASFALAYARQTEHDHQALLAAIKSGRLPAAAEKA